MLAVYSNEGYPHFKSVTAFKSQIHIEVDDVIETESYYSDWDEIGDNTTGSCRYIIVTLADFFAVTNQTTPDNYGDHLLDNGLVAMIIDRKIKNVKQYGALGDGSHDATDHFQAALDSIRDVDGGHMYIPGGTYMLHPRTYQWLTRTSNRGNYSCLTIYSNTKVTGDGPTSVCKLGSTIPDPDIVDGRDLSSTTHMFVNKKTTDLGVPGFPATIETRNLEFKGIKFDGNWISESGDGISLVSVENFKITHCYFTHTTYECVYLLFCRGGVFSHNFVNECGPYQGLLKDGGGPVIDECSYLTISDNQFTDVGYYAILAVAAFNLVISGNTIKKDTYPFATGFQAIRLGICSAVHVLDNIVTDSGYSAIWDHQGQDNVISGNIIINAGYAAKSGAAISGINIDDNRGQGLGRGNITNNIVIGSNGGGINIVGGVPFFGATDFYHTGSTVSNNVVMYNGYDGIVVYGNYHRIIGNTVEANGTDVDDQILDNGYSGIALNGAKFCTVAHNSCQDVTQANPVNLNLDSRLDNAVIAPYIQNHTRITQNWGIRELPFVAGASEAICTHEGTTTISVFLPIKDYRDGHLFVVGDTFRMFNSTDPAYNGYFLVDSIIDKYNFTYIANSIPTTSPAPPPYNQIPITNLVSEGTLVTVSAEDHQYDEDRTVVIKGAKDPAYNGTFPIYKTLSLNKFQYIAATVPVLSPDLGSPYIEEISIVLCSLPGIIAADYNTVTSNNLMGNLANPVPPAAGGYNAFAVGPLVCGGNSIVNNNIGE